MDIQGNVYSAGNWTDSVENWWTTRKLSPSRRNPAPPCSPDLKDMKFRQIFGSLLSGLLLSLGAADRVRTSDHPGCRVNRQRPDI